MSKQVPLEAKRAELLIEDRYRGSLPPSFPAKTSDRTKAAVVIEHKLSGRRQYYTHHPRGMFW